MSAIMIAYDLNSPGQNYSELHKKIKAYGTWAHLLESTWIVSGAGLTPEGVYADLKTSLDDGDHIFTVDITNSARQGWLPKTKWDWIRKNV